MMEPVVAPDLLLLLDKPYRWTSFDVVNKVRHTLNTKKVGHAGTLDPLATGLLIVCTGKMTKRIDEYQAQEKEYTGKFVIGQTTASSDLETPPTAAVNIDAITPDKIYAAAKSLTGTLSQIPPQHSAIKVNGKRAYEFARAGKEIELKAREVTVTEFAITAIDQSHISFRIICSKGTYIRSLARDFGEILGVGAYLGELRRTRIGAFSVADAKNIW